MWDVKAAFPMLANLNSRQHSLQYAACLSSLTTCNQSLYAPSKTQSELNTHYLPPPGIFNNTNVLTNRRNPRQHIQDGVHLTTWWKHPSQNAVCTKSFRRFEICVQFSNYCNATLTFSYSKKIQGVAIIFKHFYQKFFFLRAFQVPSKSNIKFQGFSSTSTSSTHHVY